MRSGADLPVPSEKPGRQTTARASDHPAGGTRSRRRGAVLEDAVLTAVWDEVAAVGYARLTIEGAAARSGTAKSVLYRRWPNRAALVHAAVRHHVGPLADQVEDTGDLRGDLLHLLRRVRDVYREVGPDILHGIMSEIDDMPKDVYAAGSAPVMAVLTRAVNRGEARRDRVTPRIAALPGDLIRNEVLLVHGDASDEFLAGLLDEILLPLVMEPAEQRLPRSAAR
jgi:AcrR family transcriptional regulator